MDSIDKIIRDHERLKESIIQKYICDTAPKWTAFVTRFEKLWDTSKENINIPTKGMDLFSQKALLLFNNFKSATINEWKEYRDSLANLHNGLKGDDL